MWDGPVSGSRATATRRRLPFHPGYLLLAAFLAFFAWKYLEKTREIQGLARQAAGLQAVNGQTLADNRRTRRLINQYRNPRYLEDMARSMLGYTLPGETPVQVIPRFQRAPVVRAAPTVPTMPSPPAWRQWWKAFFG